MKTDIENHQQGHRERLYAKLDDGIRLTDLEQIELFLCTIIPRIDVKPAAHKLCRKYKTIKNILLDSELDELAKIDKVGPATLRNIKIYRQLFFSTTRCQLAERPILATGEQMLDYARYVFRGAKVEIFYVLYLNQNKHMIKDEKHAQGTHNRVAGYPKEIFIEAVKTRAKFVLLMHNHPIVPEGGGLFSNNDIELTDQIKIELGKYGIELLDHILFQNNALFSARNWNLIK